MDQSLGSHQGIYLSVLMAVSCSDSAVALGHLLSVLNLTLVAGVKVKFARCQKPVFGKSYSDSQQKLMTLTDIWEIENWRGGLEDTGHQ